MISFELNIYQKHSDFANTGLQKTLKFENFPYLTNFIFSDLFVNKFD